jgi:hypothetical protein
MNGLGPRELFHSGVGSILLIDAPALHKNRGKKMLGERIAGSKLQEVGILLEQEP